MRRRFVTADPEPTAEEFWLRGVVPGPPTDDEADNGEPAPKPTGRAPPGARDGQPAGDEPDGWLRAMANEARQSLGWTTNESN